MYPVIERKYNEEGEVAVLISPGYGAGWSTWANDEIQELLVFDKDIVEAVLADDKVRAGEIASAKAMSIYGEGHVYDGGLRDIEVVWLPKGTQFKIDEYDGYESLEVLGQMTFLVA